MFEQIKQCRYIRHYHPFGAHSDDEDEQDTTDKWNINDCMLLTTNLVIIIPNFVNSFKN